MSWRNILLLIAATGAMSSALSGCAFTAGAATGAAATEVLHDEGYEIDSPIQKKDEDDGD